jgi:hypothetical protein
VNTQKGTDGGAWSLCNMQMKCKLMTYAIRENEVCFKSWIKKKSANLVSKPECELVLIILINFVLTLKCYTCNMQRYATASECFSD